MISIYEIIFPAADFNVVETNFDKISSEDYNTIKNMQEKMNKLMGQYESSVKEFNKLVSIDQTFARHKKQKAIIFLLKKGEEIVGYSIVLKYFVKGRFHISELYIDKNYRSGGLGQYFLNEIEKRLREKGCTVLQLNCLANNEIGNKLYTKSGFRVFQRAYAKKL